MRTARTVVAVIAALVVALLLVDLAGLLVVAGDAGFGRGEIVWRVALLVAGVAAIVGLLARRRPG